MITISTALDPDHVALDLAAATPQEALARMAAMLRNDERVVDWREFSEVLQARPPCRVADAAEFGICIPHARTDAVTDLVMSAARLIPGVAFEGCEQPVRYIFCLAVPQTMAADYLRIAGALMRLFKDGETERALREAATREEFVHVLSRLETKL